MMILSLLLAILIPQIIAFIFISTLWPGQKPLRSDFLLKMCLAVGIGFGILSCTYFLQLLLFGPSRGALVSTQIALLVLLGAALYYRIRWKKAASVSGIEGSPPPVLKLHRVLLVLFIVALIAATAAFVFISLKHPHGEWDAWAVYNMKARFLFRAGDYWRELFSEPTGWSSPDYPLLIPATMAACWTLMGRESTAVPVLVGLLFTLATTGVLVSALSLLRGKTQGLFAGLVLICTPYFITHGANQYADIPLGFFLLTSIALWNLQDRLDDSRGRLLILAGITTGLAAWTKNEGLLFLIAILASRFVIIVPTSGLRPFLRQIRFFATGLIPVLLVVICFKVTMAPPNRMLFPAEGPGVVAKLLDFSRYWIILVAFIKQALSFGSWSVSVTPVMVFYLLLIGVSIEQKEKASVAASFIALGIMLAGYFMVYVLSPLDVSLHILTSLDRVFCQLWPIFIFNFFLIVRTPEQAWMKRYALSEAA